MAKEYGRIEAFGPRKDKWRAIRYGVGGSLYGNRKQTVIGTYATREEAIKALRADIAARGK